METTSGLFLVVPFFIIGFIVLVAVVILAIIVRAILGGGRNQCDVSSNVYYAPGVDVFNTDNAMVVNSTTTTIIESNNNDAYFSATPVEAEISSFNGGSFDSLCSSDSSSSFSACDTSSSCSCDSSSSSCGSE